MRRIHGMWQRRRVTEIPRLVFRCQSSPLIDRSIVGCLLTPFFIEG